MTSPTGSRHALLCAAALRAVEQMAEQPLLAARNRGGAGRPVDHAVHIKNVWANINGPGDFNIMHTHPSSVLSGVLRHER